MAGEKKKEYFRSALELMKLLDSVLEGEERQDRFPEQLEIIGEFDYGGSAVEQARNIE